MDYAKTTILVVDDEENIRTLLKRILEGAGYAVITAAQGRECLDKLALGNIGLVLLDIKMPELNGFETLEIIRKQSDIPVIMVTGMGEVDSRMEAFCSGSDGYVSKPFNAGVLLNRIGATLRRNKKQES